MERISYAGEHLLTGTEIAHTLVAYAEALADVGQAAAVEIPTVDEHGRPGVSQMLVGPASQLVATRVDMDVPDPRDAALVEELRIRTARLLGHSPAMTDAPDDDPDDTFYTDYGI